MKKLLGLTVLLIGTAASADVPYQPTGGDELPPAITGDAGALRVRTLPITPATTRPVATWPCPIQQARTRRLS